jgi:dipeptidyl aminopeptidase/acylaminoacyl peptidase
MLSTHRCQLRYAVALCFSLAAIATQAQAQTAPPSIESFFKNPKISDVRLSPDGSSVAMLVANKDNRLMLATMDIGASAPKVIVNYSDVDVHSFHWVNDKRLVYSINDHQLAVGDTYRPPGLFGVNKDGSASLQLVNLNFSFLQEHRVRELLPANTFFYDVCHGSNSDDVYMIQYRNAGEYRGRSTSLLRVNTATGRAVEVQRPGEVVDWLVDTNGTARVATTQDKDMQSVYFLDTATSKWNKLAEFAALSNNVFTPTFLGPDGTLLVTTNKGRDTRAIYRYDLSKNQIAAEPLIELQGYDFQGHVLYNAEQKKILGVRYETDAVGTAWFDADMKQAQQKLDALLPGTNNLMTVAEEKKSDNALVYSYSDAVPGIWRLYDMHSGKLTTIGNTRPDVDPAKMAYKDMVHYRARDGLNIPAYLTLPQGAKKSLPLVVAVHGGPYVRGGHWNWNPETQFLASRGYAVLEPEFRGSTGYGGKHFSAGWKQWGLAMQDDIADAAKWAIQQGYADPKRICIVGASYGGYATLMGLIKNPELFKCGVDWVGVTDIDMLFNVAWSDMSEEYEKYGAPTLVGDQVKDKEQFRATSPLYNADKLKQPLLMAYGGSDRRVPIVHGTAFYDAVKKGNPHVEWVEYPEEGHGWKLLKTNLDFWTRVERFLGQNIGAAAQQSPGSKTVATQ